MKVIAEMLLEPVSDQFHVCAFNPLLIEFDPVAAVSEESDAAAETLHVDPSVQGVELIVTVGEVHVMGLP